MMDEKSLAHTRWNCKYHIVFVTNGAIVIHTQRLKSDPGGNL
ncbi:transposase for the insertion element domain protein, partial [Yersinia pestis PY-19]